MAKRPLEVLVLSSDSEDETPPRTSTSRSQTVSRSTARPAVVGNEGENAEFEKDLSRAMELSMKGAGGSRGGDSAEGSSGSGAGGGGALSRAEMERARLERQQQRQASGQTAPTVAVRSTTTTGSDTANKRARVSTTADLSNDQLPPSASSSSSYARIATLASVSNATAFSSSSSTSASKDTQRFWSGAVKRVSNIYHPSPDSWSFSDLIGPRATLDAAIVSAFCLDPEWVVPQFPSETPLMLVMPGRKGEEVRVEQCELKPNTYRVCPPVLAQGDYGVMHTKFQVFYHSTFLRIVIPTANAIAYDYESMDNALYIHDFPLQSNPLGDVSDGVDARSPYQNPTHTQFSKTFFQVCYKLGVPKKFLSFSTKYDFSKSTEVRLVQSMQGVHSLVSNDAGPPDAFLGGGLVALARAVQSFKFAEGGRWEIEATGSSIGSYSSNWLAQFYAACKGVSPTTYFRSAKKVLPPSNVVPLQPTSQPSKLPIKIVFPTEGEILGSWKGAEHGGTLFCPANKWKTSTFPRHLFHRGQSKRDRVPAHTKIILALHRYGPSASSSSPPVHEGWMYVGSHNFTPSAWGNLQNGSGTGPQIALNNYELGVVLPIRANSAEELERKATELVTYRRPLVPYSSTDRPWQQEYHLR